MSDFVSVTRRVTWLRSSVFPVWVRVTHIVSALIRVGSQAWGKEYFVSLTLTDGTTCDMSSHKTEEQAVLALDALMDSICGEEGEGEVS